MFELFNAPIRRRAPALRSHSLLLSAAAHGFIFSSVLYASAHLAEAERDSDAEQVTYFELRDTPDPLPLLRFRPGKAAGRQVRVMVSLPVVWTLREA